VATVEKLIRKLLRLQISFDASAQLENIAMTKKNGDLKSGSGGSIFHSQSLSSPSPQKGDRKKGCAD
jgi:hypothetical protein